MKISLITLMILITYQVSAQIELSNHVLNDCGFIILPEIEGTGLSDQLYYYQGNLDDGINFYPGDTIFTTTLLFAYDEVHGWEECLIVNIIKNVPIITMPDSIWYCNIGVLPKPIGEFITINASYYNTNEYLNPPISPGATVEESGWYYLRDGFENCYVYDSIYVAIAPPVFIDELNDTLVCQEYLIPDFSLLTNGSNVNFEDDLGNTYVIGDRILENTLLTVIATNRACSFSRTFKISVFDGFFEDNKDSIYCDLDHYPSPLSKYNHLPGFQESVVRTFNNSFSTTYIVDYQWGETNCAYQDNFTISTDWMSNYPGCIPDTSYVCNIGEINLIQYVKRYNTVLPSDMQFEFYTEYVELTNNIIHTAAILNDTLDVYFHALTIPECFDSTHIYKSTFIITDDCALKDQNDTLYCTIPFNLTKRSLKKLPFGTKLYDSNFNLLQKINDLEFGANTYYYILNLADGTRDTSIHNILYLEDIEIYPSTIDYGALCYKDCFKIEFENVEIDTTEDFIFWEIELYSAANNQYIESFYSVNDFLTICFDENIGPDQLNTANVQLENHDFYLIFDDTFTSTDNCVKNKSPDTVFFSTLFNTSRFINNILCPDEEFILLEDTFNIDNPSGVIIIENVSSYGCDSTITVDLEFDISSFRKIKETYCDTNQFLFVGCELFDYENPFGVIKLDNAPSNGCDSIVEVELTYETIEKVTNSISFCEGDTVYHIGIPIYENSIFTDTVYSLFGCDSVITETFFTMIDKADEFEFEISFNCSNQSYSIELLENYPIQLIDNEAVTDNIISNITQNELMISYGYEQDCLSQEIIKFQYPIEWGILTDNYEDISSSAEVTFSFSTELISPTISWTPSDILSCNDCPTPTLLENSDTTILLQLTDEFGCHKEEIITVTFKNEIFCEVPNVISPSAVSEENRSFYVITNDPIKYDLSIFDRWGSEIYKAKNIESNNIYSGWTPTQKFEIGVYMYLINFHGPNKESLAGSVLLLD